MGTAPTLTKTLDVPTTDEFEALASERRAELHKRVNDRHLASYSDSRLSSTATGRQRFLLRFHVFGWTGLLLFLGWFAVTVKAGDAHHGALAHASVWVFAPVFVAWIGIGLGAGYALTRLCERMLAGAVILAGYGWVPKGLLEEYDRACEHLEAAVGEGVPGAAAALSAAQEMELGLEELVVEFDRFTRIADEARCSYISKDYAAQADLVVTELQDAIVATIADLQTATRILHNQRPSLVVPVPAVSADEVGALLAKLNLSPQAQDALAAARSALRNVA